MGSTLSQKVAVHDTHTSIIDSSCDRGRKGCWVGGFISMVDRNNAAVMGTVNTMLKRVSAATGLDLASVWVGDAQKTAGAAEIEAKKQRLKLWL